MRGFSVLMILGFLAAGTTASATVITIQTQTQVTVEKNQARISVGVTNKGDEPAYNIRIATEIDGKLKSTPLKDTLQVNETYTADLASALDFAKPGKYPAVITVDYTDRNQYPFTATSIGYIDFKEKSVGRVVGEVVPARLSAHGRVTVKVKNLEQADHSFDVRLVLPKEFKGPDLMKTVKIPSGEEQVLNFDIQNISALQGSRYEIFAVVAYEDEKLHYSNALNGVIEVIQKESFVKIYRKPLIVLSVLLAGIILFLNLRRKWGSPRAR